MAGETTGFLDRLRMIDDCEFEDLTDDFYLDYLRCRNNRGTGDWIAKNPPSSSIATSDNSALIEFGQARRLPATKFNVYPICSGAAWS